MGRTDGRTDGLTDWLTDGRTDGQGGDYMLPRNFSGSIKKLSACIWAKNIAGGSDIMYCQGK